MPANGLMVGFIPNLRREKFQDERVREALNYAFDFEELSNTLFFNQYERIDSYFFGLPFRSTGLPEGEELEILNSVKDLVPPSVFTEPYTNPVSGDPAKLRENLRTALSLFNEAGYTLDGTALVDANGAAVQPSKSCSTAPPSSRSRRTSSPISAQIGVAATIRTVDSPQYINRARSLRLRRDLYRLGPVLLARQRAALLLRLIERQRGRQRRTMPASPIPASTP